MPLSVSLALAKSTSASAAAISSRARCTTNSSRRSGPSLPEGRSRSDVNTFKDYSIHVTAEKFGMTRDELAEGLLAENIETKKYFYPPMHMQTLYKQFYKAGGRDLKVTEEVTGGILSLPIYEPFPMPPSKLCRSPFAVWHNHAASRKEVSLSGRQ